MIEVFSVIIEFIKLIIWYLLFIAGLAIFAIVFTIDEKEYNEWKKFFREVKDSLISKKN